MKQIFPALLMMASPTLGMAQGQSGLVMSDLDKSVRAADDFYQFATGGWQKNNPLPAAYSRYGSFDRLQEDNNKRINNILGELLKKKFKPGSTEQKLSDYYKLAMDSTRREKEGLAPVAALIAEVEGAKTKADLEQFQLKYAVYGYGVGFGSYFAADEKNVKMNILTIGQGGLTLGQKDYYVNNDPATVAIREAFRKHIARMFRLYGFNEAQADARRDAIFRMETALALVSKSVT